MLKVQSGSFVELYDSRAFREALLNREVVLRSRSIDRGHQGGALLREPLCCDTAGVG
ncbi:MAG: hypothetical protein HZB55_21095 [Deltaproteobacteria bacterium]|nr:hypothetical protein [Deltaproteobacteria bacterium]